MNNDIIEFKSEKIAIEYLLKSFQEKGATALLAKIKPDKNGKREWDPVEVAHIDANMHNRSWRMNNLYKVRNKDGEIVPFVMNTIQKYFDEHRHYRNIILKSRQVGFTTYKTIDQLDRTLFNSSQNCILVAHREGAAGEIFKTKIEFAWNNLHPFVRDLFKIKSKKTMAIEFDRKKDNSDMSTISTDTSARSGTYSSAHVSELAYLDKYFPERASELMAGLTPAIPHTGQLDIESTARGNTGIFHDRYYAASENPASPKEFKPFFFPWMMDDYEMNTITENQIKFVTEGNGKEWERFQTYQEKHSLSDREITAYYFFWVAMGEDWDKLREEYPTTPEEAFAASEERVFPAEKLRGKDKAAKRESSGWKFFEEPKQYHRYSMGVDPSEGVEKDDSGVVIMDLETNNIVATFFRNDIEPDLLGYEVVAMAKYYNSAFVTVEKNAAGFATLSKVRELYDTNRIYKEVNKEKQHENKTNKFGWRTTGGNKHKMVYDFRSAIVEESVTINCPTLLGQLIMYPKEEVQLNSGRKSVRYGGGTYDGGHFDLCDAAFMVWQTKADAVRYLPKNKASNRRSDILKLKQKLAKAN